MKHTLILRRAILIACVCIMFSFCPALASVSATGDEDTTPAVIVEVSDSPIESADDDDSDDDSAFSVSGNAEVLDDIEDGTKEFYTITTENNNTYFLIIDKSSSADNVYMLSLIDEADLADFLEEEEQDATTVEATPTPSPTVIIQQPTAVPETTETTEEETSESSSDNTLNSSVLIIGALVLILIGGWYFKIYRPKKEAEYDTDEGLEYTTDNDDE